MRSDGSTDEELVVMVDEIEDSRMSVGSLEVEDTEAEEEEVEVLVAVCIVAAVVMVAPIRVVAAAPSTGVLSVSQIVKLYVPHVLLSEPVPQIVSFANPPIQIVSTLRRTKIRTETTHSLRLMF